MRSGFLSDGVSRADTGHVFQTSRDVSHFASFETFNWLHLRRKNTNLEKGIIHKLLHTYINGTSKKASCDYHRINGRFYGEFYYFMMTALTLLRRKVKIKIMQRDTWGDYARETIKYHYRKKQANPTQ